MISLLHVMIRYVMICVLIMCLCVCDNIWCCVLFVYDMLCLCDVICCAVGVWLLFVWVKLLCVCMW